MPRWLLPERIADALPAEARQIDDLRRGLLDLYRGYGYELVMPPLVEHLESLLTGAGSSLELRTLQVVDQLSGRRLGVRADMTPQVARIDAHLLGRQGVTRLCYAGPVFHARPADPLATREPHQIGAELYGHDGVEAELEVLELLVASLSRAGIGQLRIDLCHAGVVPALLALDASGTRPLELDDLYDLLVQKDSAGLAELLIGREEAMTRALLTLPTLYGDAIGAASTLDRAQEVLPPLPAIEAAIARLRAIAGSSLWRRLPNVSLAVDFADLSGYHYYSGVSFAAYAVGVQSAGAAAALARGGRYDGVGRAFGRARAAAGFSMDLRSLAGCMPAAEPRRAIRAPWVDDPALRDAVAALRAVGEIVVQALPGHEQEQQEFACDRELVAEDGRWRVAARR